MNERIRELSWKAFDSVKNINPNGKWRQSEYNEIFAELIVKECIDVLMKPPIMGWDEGLKSELSDYNKGWVNGRLLGIEHINEHFGVEE